MFMSGGLQVLRLLYKASDSPWHFSPSQRESWVYGPGVFLSDELKGINSRTSGLWKKGGYR